jgi:hypothetical protein
MIIARTACLLIYSVDFSLLKNFGDAHCPRDGAACKLPCDRLHSLPTWPTAIVFLATSHRLVAHPTNENKTPLQVFFRGLEVYSSLHGL